MADVTHPFLLGGCMGVHLALEHALGAIASVYAALIDGMSPFNNTGMKFKAPRFEVHAFDWVGEDRPWNFKWRDFEVSWYKYQGRCDSGNRIISSEELREMVCECVGDLVNESKRRGRNKDN